MAESVVVHVMINQVICHTQTKYYRQNKMFMELIMRLQIQNAC